MDLQTKLASEPFSDTEKAVVEFFIQHFDSVVDMTTLEVAKRTFTSNASVVRVCQKLGYKGFNDFKLKYLTEQKKDSQQVGKPDANFPIQSGDDVRTMAANIATLKEAAIAETKSLLAYGQLAKVIDLLEKAETINVYCTHSTIAHAKEFQYHCMRINKRVIVASGPGEQDYYASRSSEENLAILLSYTGETRETIGDARLCRYGGTKTISITSFGQNSLSEVCDYNFFIPPWEKYYSKIGQFASSAGFSYILDLFYSGIFEKDYLANYEYMLEHTGRLGMVQINRKMADF
jgi:DNA-binding MurR/RpiR family transcriptional regulator